MRKINFIQKLATEEKITLVEPSDEITESYNIKSSDSLKAAIILKEQNLLEQSVGMSYYAMYNKATALFRNVGIKCENHAATIILLKELFNINNKEISKAKTERIDKQYYTDFKITTKEATDSINIAEEFIHEINNFLDKLNKETKQKYLKEMKETYF